MSCSTDQYNPTFIREIEINRVSVLDKNIDSASSSLGPALNQPALLSNITLSIAAVERDTGLSKDTLRVWERRYGFPSPQRDPVGERAYLLVDVEKLRVIKRLLDAGHRPGRIVSLPVAELQVLADQTVDQPLRNVESALGSEDLRLQMALIRGHDPLGLRAALNLMLARFGVARFVNEVVGPLNAAVGDAWIRGQMEIFEEHMYTEVLQSVLRQAIAAIPQGKPSTRAPRALLTTLPGEPHGLGLLMVEAMLALDACPCVSLGVQTPLWDVVKAASALRTDIVALSFSGCTNPNQIIESLTELRQKLPAGTELWAGGSAPALRRRPIDGVRTFASLENLPAEVQRLRQRATASAVGAEKPADTHPRDGAAAR
jgi:MerR family transcriptional regulator, light-induced transcriptional regulator